MMKLLSTLLATISLGSVLYPQEAWDRNHEACDVNGSYGALCVGLSGYARLDEPADTPRGDLLECPGTDVATSTTTRFGLARSASFDGSSTKGFITYGGGGFGGGTWTVAVWVYPTSVTTTSTILSTMDTSIGKQGLTLDLFYTGSALNARARSYMQDTDTILTAQSTTNLTVNTWHLVVFQSAHSTIRKLYSTQALKVSVNNGAFTSTAWTNSPRTNSSGNLVIGKSDSSVHPVTGACNAMGGGFTGYMQGFALYGRALTANDLSVLWNGGQGRDFPFSR